MTTDISQYTEGAHDSLGGVYVERNRMRAGLVRLAQAWRWSSLWRRERGAKEEEAILAAWPVPMPSDWLERVNWPQTLAEDDGAQ